MNDSLKNKRVLITGAAGGIGKALVAGFKNAGAYVAVADRDHQHLQSNGITADVMLPGDLVDIAYTNSLCEQTYDALGGLDVLVNNAGINNRGPVTETTDEQLRRSIAINVEAPFRLCRSAIPIMSDNGGGAIVNVSSCWGLRPGPDHALYCMTKAALASLTQCMGRDHAHQNIRVNAVCPNEVDTPMLRSGFEMRGFDPATAIDSLDKTVPIGRVAKPEDIADVVFFLASDASRYMCGSLVEVNGGKAVG